VSIAALESSRALWNRERFDLDSDEVLAQLLDRGEIAAWRALYQLAKSDAHLRRRIRHLLLTVPSPLPRFWLAALASLGEQVDYDAPLPAYLAHSV
jgi:hypothetical protein